METLKIETDTEHIDWPTACKRTGNNPQSLWGRAFRHGWLDAANGIRLRTALAAPSPRYRSGYYWGQNGYHKHHAAC